MSDRLRNLVLVAREQARSRAKRLKLAMIIWEARERHPQGYLIPKVIVRAEHEGPPALDEDLVRELAAIGNLGPPYTQPLLVERIEP